MNSVSMILTAISYTHNQPTGEKTHRSELALGALRDF